MRFGNFSIAFTAILGILSLLKKNGLDCYLVAKEAIVLGKIKKATLLKLEFLKIFCLVQFYIKIDQLA